MRQKSIGNNAVRITAMLVAVAMLAVLAFQAMAESGGQRQEMSGKRSQFSRVYDNGDGTETLELYSYSINYQDAGGQWQPIETAITPNSGGQFQAMGLMATSNSATNEFKYVANKNRFQVYFGDSASQPQRFQIGDRWVQFQAMRVNDVAAQVQESTVLYANAWNNADVKYTVFPDGLKEEIILHNGSAPPAYSIRVSVNGVRAQKEADGSIGFYDETDGSKAWQIPAAVAWDSDKETPASTKVSMELKTDGNDVFLDLNIDPAWLADPARVFPVTIDPTVTDTVNDTTKEVFIPYPQTVTIQWLARSPAASGDVARYASVRIGTTPGGSEIFGPENAPTPDWWNPRDNSGTTTRKILAPIKLYLKADAGRYQYFLWNWGPGTAWIKLTYNNNPPPAVTPLEPAEGSYTGQTSPVFSWRYDDPNGNDQAFFEVQVARDSAFTVEQQMQTVTPSSQTPAGSESAYQWPAALAGGTWFWRVRGNDGEHWSDWSAPQSFVLDATAPGVPQGVSTAPLVMGVHLQWTAAQDNLSGIRSYELEMQAEGAWQSVAVIPAPTGQACSYDHTNLGFNQTFDYRLRAVDKAGNVSAWVAVQGATQTAATRSGVLGTNETWSGLVEITGDLAVPAGITLTLTPGAQIYVVPGAGLNVEGRLEAAGDAANPITFQVAGPAPEAKQTTAPPRWQGILVQAQGTAVVSYARIADAVRGVSVLEGQATLSNLTITGNVVGVHVYGATPTITACDINRNAWYGIKEDANASPQVTDCVFSQNRAGDYYEDVKTLLTPEQLNQIPGNAGNRRGK